MLARFGQRRGPDERRDPRRMPVERPRRRMPARAEAQPDDPLARDAVLARLEAALLVADEPLTLRRLAILAQIPNASAEAALARLHALYAAEASSFQVVELAGGYQLLTRPEFYPWIVRVREAGPGSRITGALLETLAVVAYRQPIMRAEIEAIRGVHCADALRELMERGLVRIAGRDHSLGRPIIYGTTKRFLQAFALRDLSELPALESDRL